MHHKRLLGFTIVELLIAVTVFSVFIVSLLLLFKQSGDSFKITSWKQQKTAESQIFWTHLKQNIEEATNKLSVLPGIVEPEVKSEVRDMNVNSNASTITSGDILDWNVSHISFDFVSSNHSFSNKIFTLKKDTNALYLEDGVKRIAKITDVDSVTINITSVVIDATTKEQILVEGENAGAFGSIIAISIIQKPPSGYMAKDLKLVQNHKFRINVKAVASP